MRKAHDRMRARDQRLHTSYIDSRRYTGHFQWRFELTLKVLGASIRSKADCESICELVGKSCCATIATFPKQLSNQLPKS